MDALANNHTLQVWLINYGSVALFFLLTIGILALPVPEETLMILAGVLMSHGELKIPQTVMAAFLGSLCGITTSYLLGRAADRFLLHRYGRWIGIGEVQINKAHAWFEHFGKWSLFIGYFIPGIRHFTGLLAGMTFLEYREFALFAYSGAFIWVLTFLSLGYFFGDYGLNLLKEIDVNVDDILTILIILIFVCIIFYLFKNRKSKE